MVGVTGSGGGGSWLSIGHAFEAPGERDEPRRTAPGRVFLFLADPENGYINGETIRIDGALRMSPR